MRQSTNFLPSSGRKFPVMHQSALVHSSVTVMCEKQQAVKVIIIIGVFLTSLQTTPPSIILLFYVNHLCFPSAGIQSSVSQTPEVLLFPE